MKNLKPEIIVKILLVILMLGAFFVSGKRLYDYSLTAQNVDETLVESYQPVLDIVLVKKAAESLERGN